MAHIRRLPSGRWKAEVLLPDRRRITRTDPLKKVVEAWARDVEADLARGRWHDPRPARTVTVGDWHAEWLARRLVAATTADKDASTWRTRVGPRWTKVPLSDVTRPAVERWVKELVVAGVGPARVVQCVHYLSAMLTGAAEAGLLPANPAARVRLPTLPLKPPFYWTRPEIGALLRELEEPWRTAVDLDVHTGLRIGELTGMAVAQVDWAARLIHVTRIHTRKGFQEHPKGRRRRTVPLPDHLLDPVHNLIAGRAQDALVFPAPEGGPMEGRNFANRILEPAISRAHIRRGTPHDLRATAASWLVADGVDLYRVSVLLGHSSTAVTERHYAFLAPDAHDAIRSAWNAAAAAAETAGEFRQSARSPHEGPQTTKEAMPGDPEHGL